MSPPLAWSPTQIPLEILSIYLEESGTTTELYSEAELEQRLTAIGLGTFLNLAARSNESLNQHPLWERCSFPAARSSRPRRWPIAKVAASVDMKGVQHCPWSVVVQLQTTSAIALDQ